MLHVARQTLQGSQSLALDPARMRIGPDGVADFFWPVSRERLGGFRDRLLTALNSEVTATRRRSEDEADLLQIALPGLLFRGMALFEALLVIDAAKRSSLDLLLPPSSFNLAPLLRGEAPREHPTDPRQRLRQVFPSEPAWRDAARFVWNRFRKRDIPIRSLSQVDPDRDILCASIQGAIPAHAAAVADRVVYCHPRGWFPNQGASPTPQEAAPLSEERLDAVVEALAEAATAFGNALPPFALDYLRDYLKDLTGLIRGHLDRLARKPHRLPKRLWLVTGINPWCRTLVCATRRAGGKAIGHEHGTGESWSRVCGDTALELDMLDGFVTYTEEGARRLREHAAGLDLPRREPCVIEPLAQRPRASRLAVARPRKDGDKPRVTVVTTFYRGDEMRYKPQPADIVSIDWHARLFAKLRAWDCQVQFRPHPEDSSAVHEIFAERMDIPSLGGTLTEAMAQSDLLIFDNPLSSAFADSLCSDLPIVLVDFGHSPFWRDTEDWLARRVTIVKGAFDAENRAVVDWEALRNAMGVAKDLGNTDFHDAFFGDLV